MANTPINNMTATFGSGDQTAIKMNVSDVGPSDNTSKLIDLQVGSTSKFRVVKSGAVIALNYTGSFSGSNFIKDQSAATGTKYLVFSNGSGANKSLGIDTTLNYDAIANTLNTNGSINVGGDVDSTNASPLLFGSPTTIDIGSSATTIKVGSTSAGSYTHFYSKQVRGNFTGSFTGSFSGSVNTKFNKLSASNARISNRLVASNITGSISGSLAKFTKLTSSFISGAFANFTHTTGSFISGGLTNFTVLSGSSGQIQNKFNIDGNLNLVNAITCSNMFISGAGSPIAGYIGILVDGTKYKLALYPWS